MATIGHHILLMTWHNIVRCSICSLEFLILASDGLWDVVTNKEAVSMLSLPIQDPEDAARRLMHAGCTSTRWDR
ncbi:unnamed protein product [Coffea canephora]|uniref:PPM-type phosphatase domain-containing protein n=1 Tax=Coffea canephora TaxID=49390 RepID=A0A068V4M4_COFCA|nr:unnamed protein product [Coffea canephora]